MMGVENTKEDLLHMLADTREYLAQAQAELADCRRQLVSLQTGADRYRAFFENSTDGFVLVDAQGAVAKWNRNQVGSITRDVTARKQADAERERLLDAERRAREEAQGAEARLQAVLQQMPAGVLIAEAPSGRIILDNRQMERILGGPFEQPAGIEEYPAFLGFHADGRPYAPAEWPLARSIRAAESRGRAGTPAAGGRAAGG